MRSGADVATLVVDRPALTLGVLPNGRFDALGKPGSDLYRRQRPIAANDVALDQVRRFDCHRPAIVGAPSQDRYGLLCPSWAAGFADTPWTYPPTMFRLWIAWVGAIGSIVVLQQMAMAARRWVRRKLRG